MNPANLYNTLYLIAAFQLLLFSTFLFSIKKGKRHCNTILAVFFLSKFLVMTNHILYDFKISWPHIYYWGIPFAFLWGPSLYLYINAMIYKHFRLRYRLLFHAIPFIVCWFYFLFAFHLQNKDIKLLWISAYTDQITRPRLIFNNSLHLQTLIYMILTLITLILYQREIKNQFSSIERMKMSWLCFVVLGFISIWILDVVKYVFSIHGREFMLLTISPMLLLFFFSAFVVLKGLRQPDLFNGIDQKIKYKNSPLTRAEQESLLTKITEYMNNKKPYLEPSISLNDLSRSIGVHPRYVSQVINESLNQNFFDFINSYRIEEAKQMLTASREKNILQILLDVGFNSKSVFNRVFKKYTRITPREFRQMHSH